MSRYLCVLSLLLAFGAGEARAQFGAAAPSAVTSPAEGTPAATEKPKPAEQTPAKTAETEVKLGSRLGESRRQQWEFGISVRAMGGACMGLLGTFPVPTEWPEQQVKVVSEEITPIVRRHSLRTEVEGLRQVVFDVPQLPAGSTATCFVTFEVVRHGLLPPEDPSGLVIPKDPPREVRRYLGPSPLVESTNARIRTFAKELVEGKESAWEQIQALQEGVRERVKFEPENKDVFKGAAGALRDEQADKEDLTALFVAACRTIKVPARMVWALDYCYAEFYLEDSKKQGAWFPCVVHEPVELGAVKDLRPILEKGDNFKVNEAKAPQRFVREFLTGKGGGGRPSVEFRRRNAD